MGIYKGKTKSLVIGTRGSRLALWQSQWIKSRLESIYPDLQIELRIIHTRGDKIIDTALSLIGGKGLFTREIEEQLLKEEIDLAVHSLKDLPTEQPAGLQIASITRREDPRDVLVCKEDYTLTNLPSESTVFTSSLRRRAQLLHFRPDLAVQDIRGNVDTRLGKLENSEGRAIIMAAAGLVRLELSERISEYLSPVQFVPACGQGALALEIREDNADVRGIISPLDHQPTHAAVSAERMVLARLEGGCQTPLGAYATIAGGGLELYAFLSDLDGKNYLKSHVRGTPEQAIELGQQAADNLLEQGGDKILEQIRNGQKEYDQ